MTTTIDEFRVHGRAVMESLLRAVRREADPSMIDDELKQADYFESEAMKHIQTPRERALGMGLQHTIDLVRAVSEAEFHTS